MSAGNITALTDLSGNGNNVAAIGTVPLNVAAINGRDAWTNGTVTGFSGSGSPIAAGSARTVVAIVKPSSLLGGAIFDPRTSVSTDGMFLGGNGGPALGLISYDGVSVPSVATYTPGWSTGQVLKVIFSHAASPSLVSASINGVAQTITQTSGSPVESGAAGWSVGNYSLVAGIGFIGDIAEFWAWDSVLPASSLAILNSYTLEAYGV